MWRSLHTSDSNLKFQASNITTELALIEIYLLSSLLSTGLLWSWMYWREVYSLGQLFFLSTLVVVQYGLYVNWPMLWAQFNFHWLSGLVFFQYIGLLFTAHELQNTSLVYLSFIPLLGGSFFLNFINLKAQSAKHEKLYLFGLIGICSFTTVVGLYQHSAQALNLKSMDYGLFMVFLVWSWSFIYQAGKFLRNRARHLLYRGINLLHQKQEAQAYAHHFFEEDIHIQNDRRAYHDLVSQLHNALLFLDHKKMNHASMDKTDIELLQQELTLLMNQFKHIFNYQHRHIPDQSCIMSFASIKKQLSMMFENLLPIAKVESHIVFRGLLENPQTAMTQCFVNFPALHRIVLNLLLNIAESGSRQVEVVFDFRLEGLYMQFKNKILKLKDERDLAQHLKQIISSLEEQRSREEVGDGLASVMAICEQLGGDFDFGIQGDYWVSMVFLPNAKDSVLTETNPDGSSQAA